MTPITYDPYSRAGRIQTARFLKRCNAHHDSNNYLYLATAHTPRSKRISDARWEAYQAQEKWLRALRTRTLPLSQASHSHEGKEACQHSPTP